MIWFLCTLPFGEGWGGAIFAQNLVPNPSFEDTLNCPIRPNGTFASNIFSCQNWYSPTSSIPYYFNACAPHIAGGNRNVPNNYPSFGWQYARTGNAYAEIQLIGSASTNCFIQVELTDTLINNHKYCVEFYVNRLNNVNAASNNIGMYFSDLALQFPNPSDYIGLIPQINETNVISDTVNWVSISGEYMANGGEQYITIGNFYSLANTDTININNTGYIGAAYYIDDVSVWDCTGSGIGINEMEDENGMVVSPNPNEGVFEVKSAKYKMKRVEVYNVMGEIIRIYELGIRNESTIKIDISNESSGIYFVEVETEKGVVRKKVIKSTMY